MTAIHITERPRSSPSRSPGGACSRATMSAARAGPGSGASGGTKRRSSSSTRYAEAPAMSGSTSSPRTSRTKPSAGCASTTSASTPSSTRPASPTCGPRASRTRSPLTATTPPPASQNCARSPLLSRSVAGIELSAPLLEKRRDALDHRLWFAIEAGAGDSDHLYALELQVLLAPAVALEGGAGAVGLVDVEFDREALGLPVGVQLVPGLAEVHRGR